MKRTFILSMLTIASLVITSCGRKKSQVNPSTDGSDKILSSSMSCESLKKDDEGSKYNLDKYLDLKKSKVLSLDKNKEALDYVLRVYAAFKLGDNSSSEKPLVKLISPVFKKSNTKLQSFMTENSVMAASVGAKAEEKLGLIIYKNKLLKDASFKHFTVSFAKESDCVEITLPKPQNTTEAEGTNENKGEESEAEVTQTMTTQTTTTTKAE